MWILLLFLLTSFISLLVVLTRNDRLDRGGVLAADIGLHGAPLFSLRTGDRLPSV